MLNIFLRPFYQDLQLKIGQTIFADNRVRHMGKLNFAPKECTFDLGLINTCKNFSLAVTIFDQDFNVIRLCDNFQSFSQTNTKVDGLICFLNLSHISYEERYNLVKQMQKHAPKALFIDYENSERNIAYPMYYSLILGEYISLYVQKIRAQINKKIKRDQEKNTQKADKQIEYFNQYIKNGALEGFIYDIPAQTGIIPKIIKQKHLYFGGIGLFYCEW